MLDPFSPNANTSPFSSSARVSTGRGDDDLIELLLKGLAVLVGAGVVVVVAKLERLLLRILSRARDISSATPKSSRPAPSDLRRLFLMPCLNELLR